MLSAVTVHSVIGMSDTTRPLVLIGFVVLMFGIAGLALFLGKRRMQAQQARAIDADTGVMKGATKGADTSFDDKWFDEMRNEHDDSDRHSWADAILGPGALHDDTPDEDGVVLPPEIRLQRESAALTQDTAWVSPAEPAWAPDSAPTPDAAPVPVPAPTHTPKHAAAPFLVDSGLDDDED